MPLPQPHSGESLGFHAYPRGVEEGTLGDPEEIIWSSIRHFCSRGVAEWMALHKHKIGRKRDRAEVARNLKVYLEHAWEFYQAARSAKPNTAPLIYYYSFLNLAKGLCELRRPFFHSREECYRHGLSWSPNRRKVVDQHTESVSITRRGVWHTLWEAVTLKPCNVANQTELPIRNLFSYCLEISSEYKRIFASWVRLLDMRSPDLLVDGAGSESWLRFSIERGELANFGLSARAFLAQISTPRSGYTEVKSGDKGLRMFETATARRLRRGELPWVALHDDVLGLNVFAHLGRDAKLMYLFPIQASLPTRMPQLLVSYTILFWLGSLVRYDPHSVRWLMDSGYWILIDGFMSQSRLWLLELFRWAFYQEETTLWVTR